MIYAIYDRSTMKVVRRGIAATIADCVLQVADAAAQAVIAANTDDDLATIKTSLGVTE